MSNTFDYYKNFTIFRKKRKNAPDVHNYKLDVSCLQEIQIKGYDINVGVRQHK